MTESIVAERTAHDLAEALGGGEVGVGPVTVDGDTYIIIVGTGDALGRDGKPGCFVYEAGAVSAWLAVDRPARWTEADIYNDFCASLQPVEDITVARAARGAGYTANVGGVGYILSEDDDRPIETTLGELAEHYGVPLEGDLEGGEDVTVTLTRDEEGWHVGVADEAWSGLTDDWAPRSDSDAASLREALQHAEYTEVVTPETWGDDRPEDLTLEEHEAAADRMAAYIGDHPIPGVEVTIRCARPGELGGRVERDLPRDVSQLVEDAWDHALKTWPTEEA